MPKLEYVDFELSVTREAEKGYRVRAHCDSGGESSHTFEISEIDLPEGQSVEAAQYPSIRIGETGRNVQLIRTDPPPTLSVAELYGNQLFRVLFKDETRALLATCLARSPYTRLRLNFTAVPELLSRPWELLYQSDRRKFFAYLRETPIIRFQEQATPIQALNVRLPLRIPVVVSKPLDFPALSDREEIASIEDALRKLDEAGLAHLEVVLNPSVGALITKLRGAQEKETPFHIFHYIGHGVFDPVQDKGFLLFTDEKGSGELVEADRIGIALYDFREQLRLIVMNSCEGARISSTNAYCGFAQAIMKVAEIPAAIGTQFAITDRSAVIFARHLYDSLARGNPLEAALSDTRLQLYAQANREWATPVLYLRSSDGQILNIDKGPLSRDSGVGGVSMPSPADVPCQAVREAFQSGQLVIFLGLDVNAEGRGVVRNWTPGKVLPTTSELYDYLISRYKPDGMQPPIAPFLTAIAQNMAVSRQKGDLYTELNRIFGSPSIEVPSIYSVLANIFVAYHSSLRQRITDETLRRNVRLLIVTTTYDKSIERSFDAMASLDKVNDYHIVSYTMHGDQAGAFSHIRVEKGARHRATILETPNDYCGLTDDLPIILKFPGAIESEPNFALTEDHFFSLSHRSLSSILPPQIVSKLRSSHHLYLGCTLRDWSFRGWLYSIWEDNKVRYESWAVGNNQVDSNYWRSCEVEVISESPSTFIQRCLGC